MSERGGAVGGGVMGRGVVGVFVSIAVAICCLRFVKSEWMKVSIASCGKGLVSSSSSSEKIYW